MIRQRVNPCVFEQKTTGRQSHDTSRTTLDGLYRLIAVAVLLGFFDLAATACEGLSAS